MANEDYIGVFMNATQSGGRANDALELPGWSASEWRELLGETVLQPCRASDVVVTRDSTDRDLFLVASGSYEVGVMAYYDGASVSSVAKIGVGSVIGEQSFFDGAPRSANVWAISDGDLLRLKYDAYVALARRNAALGRDFAFALGRVLSVRLRNTTIRVRR